MTCHAFVESRLALNRSLLLRAESARNRLDEAAWNLAPANGWTPAQIFEHMVLANGPYLSRLAEGLPMSPKGSDMPVRFTWFGRLIYRMSGPGGNASPPKVMIPGPGPFDYGSFEKWRGQQERFVSLLESAGNANLGAVRLHNPFVRLFKMTLCDYVDIWSTHTDRHVGQIEARVST